MDDLIALVRRNYLKNRTIVSKDIRSILDDIAAACDLPLTLHRFPSGTDVATWVVPDSWDVREAWLKGPDGSVIASYQDHPLFLAPYSMPFSGRLPLAELKTHIRSHPTQRDAFYYEHRLAYDFKLRLKEWRITLPLDVADHLPDGDYEVKIDVEVTPGEMLVGEIVVPGDTDEQIALLADYCHPGQVGDSFSGVVAMIDVVRRLKALKRRRHTFVFYIFPETIGSSVLLASQPDICDRTRAAIFSEFVGWGDEWLAAVSDAPGSLASNLANEAAHHWGDIRVCGLFDAIGNDERVFDYAGVPSLSIQKTGIAEYHSSNDSPDRLRIEDLKRAADIIFRMCQAAEDDAIYQTQAPCPDLPDPLRSLFGCGRGAERISRATGRPARNRREAVDPRPRGQPRHRLRRRDGVRPSNSMSWTSYNKS